MFRVLRPRSHQGRAVVLMALMLLGTLALSACGSTAPDASSLIHDAQKAINSDTAFHFTMKLDHPGTGSAAGVSIDAADGDVLKPDKTKGTATVSQGGAAFEVQFIGIGSQQYVLTPLSPSWMQMNLGINLGQLLDPTTGVSAILGDLKNPQNVGDDTVLNDGDCWLVEGTVPSGALAPITGGDPSATAPIDTTVCIAKNLDAHGLRQPYQIILKGIATDGDTAKTTRTFTLTKFNESIDIEPPPQ